MPSRRSQLRVPSSTENYRHIGASSRGKSIDEDTYLCNTTEKRSIMAVLSLSVAGRAIRRLALLHLCTHIHRATVPAYLLMQLNNSRYRSSSLSNRRSKPLLVVTFSFFSPSFLLPFSSSNLSSLLVLVYRWQLTPMAVSPELLCVTVLGTLRTSQSTHTK